MSAIQPLIDALPFIKFTDRAIGNRFLAAIKVLDSDLDEAEEGYEPSTEAEQAYLELEAEIKDAVEKAEEDEELEEVKHELEDKKKEEEDEEKENEIIVELEKDEEEAATVLDLDAEGEDPLLNDDEEAS